MLDSEGDMELALLKTPMPRQPTAELDDLISDLFSGEEERAQAAVEALPGYGRHVVERLSRALARRKGSEPKDVDARWWILRALAEIQDPRVPALLEYGLLDEDAGVRQCAALGLRKHPDPSSIPALAARLEDPDQLTASLAADALAEIGSEATAALLEVLESGSASARLEAVRALARIGDKRSIPALFQIIEKGDSAMIEHWASEALEKMGLGMTFFGPD